MHDFLFGPTIANQAVRVVVRIESFASSAVRVPTSARMSVNQIVFLMV
ncbi:hypothetical protein [Burkholderia sp. Bp9142]|nr:hypothetical protein [Burkholderia sp. Bp9142]